MKRSLFIAIVVLLMAALFVSCNADKALEDQLFEVSIDEGAKALQATGEFDIDINQYYWFYTATKTSGGFRTGEKTAETPVKTANDAPAAGIIGASLGSFSKGTWEFSFFGYANPADKGTEAKRVYLQTGLSQTVSSAVSLAITLVRGEGALPPATVVFDKPTWYHEDFKTLPANQTTGGYELTLKVLVGENATEAWKTVTATTVDGKATFEFADTDVLELSAQTTLLFRVYWGTDLVGSENLVIPAAGSTKYTVSDLNDLSGITPVDENYGVVVFDANVPGLEETEATGTISVSPVDATVVKAGVAPVSTEQTTVTFPAGAFGTTAETHELTIQVADATQPAVSAFQIQTEGAAIAALSFTIDESTTTTPTTTTFSAPVEVETYIQPGLSANSVAVEYVGTYSGTDAQPTDVVYDPATGKLTFKVTHFSDYVIVSTKAVARIGANLYEDFAAAITASQNGNTIILLKDVTANGFVISGKAVTLAINGKKLTGGDMWVYGDGTLTVDGTVTGSLVHGCFCIGKAGNNNGNIVINGGTYECDDNDTCLHINGECLNSDVTIKNAKITSPTDNGIQLNGSGTFLLENCEITGATAVYVKSGVLTINGGTYTGNMAPANYSYYGNGANATGDAIVIDSCEYPGGAPTVIINSGVFTGTKSAVGYYTYDGNNDGVKQEATITINAINGIENVEVFDFTAGEAYTLAGFRDAVNAGTTSGGRYLLFKDVDLANTAWTPIGTKDHPFNGVFDGQNHTISNYSVTGVQYYAALFGYVTGSANNEYDGYDDIWINNALDETKIAESKYSAVIKNLNVSGADCSSTKKFAAGLVAYANNAYIYNCSVANSTVSTGKVAGGLVATINGSIVKDCTSYESNTVSASQYHAAGLICYINYPDGDGAYPAAAGLPSAVINSNNYASISCTNTGGNGGGYAGVVANINACNLTALTSAVINCSNSGNITISSPNYPSQVGGITASGQGVSVFASCINTGDIEVTSAASSANLVAGIVASMAGADPNGRIGLYNCVNSGDVSVIATSDMTFVAGIIAQAENDEMYIDGCTNTGVVSCKNTSEVKIGYISTILAQINQISTITYKNMEFADLSELSEALPQYYVGISDSGSITIDSSVVVTDNTGILELGYIRRIVAYDGLCTQFRFKGAVPGTSGTTRSAYADIPNAKLIIADGETFTCGVLALEADGMGIVNDGTFRGGVELFGENVTVINNGAFEANNGNCIDLFGTSGTVTQNGSFGTGFGGVYLKSAGTFTVTGAIPHVSAGYTSNNEGNVYTVTTV